LPPIVRRFIQDRYLAGTANAEAQYRNAAGDEDSLTGALGALISTSGPVGFAVDSETNVFVEISYRKLRGRGHDAPEKRFGADGIFQIDVSADNVGRRFKKGLPFQAKKNWKGRDSRLAKQAEEMQRTLHAGIVIDYTPAGYDACGADAVVHSRGNRRVVDMAGSFQPLGQMLANSFLDCEIGTEGLYYDDKDERFLRMMDHGFAVFDTNVAIVGPRLADNLR
jgi:hypothetical protein